MQPRRLTVTLELMKFDVVLESEEDGRFSVYVPALPGCASMGDTQAEALANIREAIAGHLAGLRDDGLPLPKPKAQILSVQVDAA